MSSRRRPRFILDAETASVANLRDTGPQVYFEHPTTHVICAAYRVDAGPIQVWQPGMAPPQVPGDAVIVAHNYLFEWHLWPLLVGRHGWRPRPDLENWSCTMARALYHGYPAGLEQLSKAMKLKTGKLTEARALMLRMARPRGYGPRGEPLWWDETDDAKLAELCAYCVQDVAAESEADARLPELPASERAVFVLDGRANTLGLRVDTALVARMDRIGEQTLRDLNHAMGVLTGGAVTTTNQIARLDAWLKMDQGVYVRDFREATLAEVLQVTELPDKARDALQLRAFAARASTRKLVAITKGLSRDGRLRGLFQYGGAGRTLRWAGRRVQPQNFPRGMSGFPVGAAVGTIMAGATGADLELLYGHDVLTILATCLRGVFVASPRMTLVVGDLDQIEARVIAWLAGQDDILEVFQRGEDVYKYTARRVGSTDRQFGKVLVLACGFGMGPARFQATARTYKLELSLTAAEHAVRQWRDMNRYIVSFWYDLGNAFMGLACAVHGASERVGRLVLRRVRGAIFITLPSGRDMVYHSVAYAPNEDGIYELTFAGVDPKTKQWSRQRTYGGKLAENVVQALARDVLAAGWVRAGRSNLLTFVGTIHDELIAEAPEDQGEPATVEMLNAMSTPLPWAPGLPLAAKGWHGTRYRKS